MTRFYLVDAFTSKVFSGNPAGVCVMDSPADDSWMQKMAAEVNVAETAFLSPRADHYLLRWFTPEAEVDLCGHGTLAASHILWEQGCVPPDRPIRFETRSGTLFSRQESGWITMDFPSEPATEARIPPGLEEALGAKPVFVGKNRFDYLVELDSAATVENLSPDYDLIARLPARGIIVTAGCSKSRYDFVSRFFAPGIGIDEDQVTGSAHCCLAPYWGRKLEKDLMIGYQASERGGTVRVAIHGSRVDLSGHAVTVITGDLA